MTRNSCNSRGKCSQTDSEDASASRWWGGLAPRMRAPSWSPTYPAYEKVVRRGYEEVYRGPFSFVDDWILWLEGRRDKLPFVCPGWKGVCRFASNSWYCGLPFAVILLTITQCVVDTAVPRSVQYTWGIHAPPHPIDMVRVVSYMFAHADVGHLVGNMTVQLMAGIPLELLHGPFRFLGMYLYAGIIGGTIQALRWYPTEQSPYLIIIGSSGAVYGLIGAYASHLYLNWEESLYPTTASIVFLGYLLYDIVIAFLNRAAGNYNVALVAHYAGALGGMLLGVVVQRNIRIEKYETTVRRAALVIDVALLVTTIALFASRIE